MQKYKTIFSLRIRKKLRNAGYEPVMETDNANAPGLKCWVYEATPDFLAALDAALEGGSANE